MTEHAPPSCDYCGLPLPRSWWSGSATGPQFCCFGCRLAAEVTRSRGEEGAVNWTLTRLGLAVFFTFNVMVFTMALWTRDFYGPEGPEAISESLRGLFRYASLLFSLPVLFLLAGPLLEEAWQALRHGRLSTDLLLIVGVVASFVYSAVSVFRDSGPVYFEVGCGVLVLVTLGRWLEATGKLKTTEAIEALQKLLPENVRRILNGEEHSIRLADIGIADCLRVLPGERIPCDGVVSRGTGAVDEQILTGESTPKLKHPEDRVLGGTLNLDGDLLLRVTATAQEGTLARLIELVRRAREAKGHYQRLADRWAAYFLPAVIVVALLAAAWHTVVRGSENGILVGLAVVLIACPCALGLATPMAIWAALGRAARAQVLFRNSEALERLASVRVCFFDKTGTITDGTPRVEEFAVEEPNERSDVLRFAGLMTAASTHVHSIAISRFIGDQFASLVEVRVLPGVGLSACGLVPDATVFLGSLRLMAEHALMCRERLSKSLTRAQEQGLPLCCIGWQGRIRGVFVFREQLRPEAESALAALHGLGLDVAVLTGDHAASGAALGKKLGIGVHSGLLPEDKVAVIDRARKRGPVAMVGDGINDAPALAHSDVGIALGCGTDVARDSAGVCLLGNDLQRLPWAVELARRTVRVIRENLFWAFVYNIGGIAVACTGMLNPVLAAFIMVLSSLLVVGNSMRMRDFGPDAGPGLSPVATTDHPHDLVTTEASVS
jgi:heavy metal translocating P-type ATPase